MIGCIKKQYFNIKQNKFAKNVMLITGGTIIAQILNILLSPVITRIYTPEEYGVLTIYTALLGMISLLGAFSYDSAIPIAESDEKAVNVLALCVLILLTVSFLLSIVTMLFSDVFLKLFNAEEITRYSQFITIGFFTTGVYTIFSNWALRYKDFKGIATTKYSQTITSNITKIGLGVLSCGPVGLILGRILGESAGISTLSRTLLKQKRHLLKSINFKDIKWSAKRYYRFPIYSAPGLLLLSISGQIPTVFISSLYGTAVVGLFGLAQSISFLPMTVIGKSVQDVFYGEAADIGQSNPRMLKSLSNKLLKKLIIIGALPMITLLLFGPFLFSLVFGSSWYEAGVYARIISPFVFTHFIFHPISVIFSIFEQQHRSLFLSAVRLSMVFFVFGVSKILGLDAYITIGMYSLAMSAVELSKYLLAQRVLSKAI